MTTLMVLYPAMASYQQPTEKSRKFVMGGSAVGAFPLPTDPVGQVALTFSGVKVGSEIKIFDTARNLLAGTDVSGGDDLFALSYYAPGSASNNVRILIIALGFEVLDLNYTLPQTNATIPVFQRIDRTYRNPS